MPDSSPRRPGPRPARLQRARLRRARLRPARLLLGLAWLVWAAGGCAGPAGAALAAPDGGAPAPLVVPLPPTAPAGVSGRGQPDPVGVWPLVPQPEVVRGFDPPEVRWGSGHRGVDLAGRVGQAVRTALPGRVRFAGRLAGRGVVVVGHGATRTTYEPVAASVAVGDVLVAGDVIGRLELAGTHCLPAACLHWGWLRGETYLDPLRLVGAVPVRLLPW